MTANKKISIIIPVYNSEQFLKDCITSILNQTYSNWEAIFIDDGSSDRSLDILNDYAQQYEKIKIIHQANAGAGMARNVGIEKSKGDYIVFLDSDDIIKSNYLEQISNKSADVIFIDIDCVDKYGKALGKEFMSPYKYYKIEDLIKYQMTGAIPWGGVRKVVSRKLLNKNNIRFSNSRIGEESVYSFNILLKAETIDFIEGPVYSYVHRSESLSHSIDEDPWGKLPQLHKENIKRMEDVIQKEYYSTINALSYVATAVSMDRIAIYSSNYNEFLSKAKLRKHKLTLELENEYAIDYKHMNTKSMIISWLIKRNFFRMIYFLSNLRNKVRRISQT